MSFGEKLAELRKENGFASRKAFADFLEIPENTLRNYERNEREPGHTFLKKVSDTFDVSIDYLLGASDRKDKVTDYQLTKQEWSLIERYRSLDTTGQQAIDWMLVHEAKRTDELTDAVRRSRVIEYPETATRTISYYQRVSAGAGEVIYEDIQPEQIRIPMDPKYRRVGYALKVSGHSMEPLYYDGDIILIEPTCTVDVGEIGIFNVDGKAYLKKRGLKELISLNKGYANIPLTSEARCMGRVVDKL